MAAADPRQCALGDQLVLAPPDQPGVSDVNLHRPGGPLGGPHHRDARREALAPDAVDRLPGCLLRRWALTPNTTTDVGFWLLDDRRLGYAGGVLMPDVDASSNAMCNRGKSPFGDHRAAEGTSGHPDARMPCRGWGSGALLTSRGKPGPLVPMVTPA